MTEHASDHENPSKTPSRPEGQDTSENMDNKTPYDSDPTEVLPAAETPPTQEIAQATQTLPESPAPEGPATEGPATEGPAPEGEVHPAYGIAAARAQEQEAAAAGVQDAPAPDDSDPLAPLRDPDPEVPTTPVATVPTSGTGPGVAQPGHTQGTHPQPTQAQPVQPVQPAATKRGPRVGTAVWGLIVIAVGLGILAVSAGVIFDLGVALIVLLGAAGVILVVGSVVSSLRRR
jgi:hypothetical protein